MASFEQNSHIFNVIEKFSKPLLENIRELLSCIHMNTWNKLGLTVLISICAIVSILC